MNGLWRRQAGNLAFTVTLISTLIHLILAFGTGLVADEAYYWTWSLHPAAGYFDHPPLTAWILWVTTHLFGVNRLAIRILPILSGLILSWILYQLAKSLSRDRWAGFWAVVLLNGNILFAAGGFLMTPDTPQVVLYALTLWAFIRGITENKKGFILLSGLFFGLGLLSKYPMVLLAPLIFLFLLLSDEHRQWLKRPVLWLSLFLAFLIFLPDILWNRAHQWVSFRFQWHHGMQAHQGTPVATFLDYLGGQILVLTPGIYLLLLWVGVVSFSRAFIKKEIPILFLWLTSYPVLLFFAYSSLKAKVEANWPVEGYLSAFVLAGIILSERLDKSVLLRRWTLGGVALGGLMIMVVFIQALYPLLPLNPKMDGTGRLHGMQRLDREIRRVAGSLPQNERPAAWVVDGYQKASELKFLEYGRTPVYHIFPQRHFRTDVISPDEARRLSGKPVLLIQDGPGGEFYRKLQNNCEKPDFLGTISVPRRWARSTVPVYQVDVYLIGDFRGGFASPSVCGKIK